ncbi:MAG: hypothetical protein ACP5E5_12380 [Acidobacteriaceae bacterium]
MRLSIQRFRWVLLAGAVALIIVLAAFIGYGRYRALQAYRQIIARSGVSITHDSNGVTYSQSVKGRKVFTLRARTESDLGNGKYALHDAELVLDDHSGNPADHISGSEIEYDENEGVARAAGEVYMDIEPPQALTNRGGKTAQPSSPEAMSSHRPGRNLSHASSQRSKPSSSQSVMSDQSSVDSQVIHVRTSGLVYVRKSGIASTNQQAEFTYGQMRCTSLGAVFDTNHSTLDLLSKVHLDGLAHGHLLHVTALRANLNRNTDIANLNRPVVTSEGRTAQADSAIVSIRKDGSIRQVQGIDHVVMNAGTKTITASRLDAWLSPQSVPQKARLSGNVVLTDTDPQLPRDGSAQEVDASFDAKGTPTQMVATGAVRLSEIDRRSNPRGLRRAAAGERMVVFFVPIKGETRHASSGSRNSTQVREIDASGSASASAESLAAKTSGGAHSPSPPTELKNNQIWADNLRLLFVATDGQSEPQLLYGTGHTVLQQDAPLHAQEVSTGDTLVVDFASAPTSQGRAGANQEPEHPVTPQTRPQAKQKEKNAEVITIVSATQSGHVTVRDRAADTVPKPGSYAGSGVQPGAISTGSAERGVYLGSTQTITLSGDAHLYDASGSISAPTISMDQRTGDADADGGVQGAFQNASSTGNRSGTTASSAEQQPVTHVLASSAHFDHALQLATFYGSDQKPARMWQQASQVLAARLIFDGQHRTFSARPAQPGVLIHAIFASNPAEQAPAERRTKASQPRTGASSGSGHRQSRSGGADDHAVSIIRVASPKMDYSDLLREATFSGGVTIREETGVVRGRRAVAYLTAAAHSNHGVPAAPDVEKISAPTIAAQPNPLGNSIDHVVVDGAVQVEQPGRHGFGEQLIYKAAQGTYLLTGTPQAPPSIVDAQQGNITGTSLFFGDAGSTIVVTGGPGGAKGTGGRVRTETHVSSGKEETQ